MKKKNIPFRKRLETISAISTLVCGLTIGAASAIESSKIATLSDAIHDSGPLGNSDFYGGGNDGSGFEEYGIAEFRFDAGGDFGNLLASIDSIELDLTYNDRSFTTDGIIEFFLTTIPASSYAGLFFDPNFTAGIDPAQFGSNQPISLGQQQFSAIADGLSGGETITYSLSLSGMAQTTLLNAINGNSEFSIILGGIDSTVEATHSGVGNTFDPGDPLLRINATAVPEPGTVALLAVSGLATLFAIRRRRKVTT